MKELVIADVRKSFGDLGVLDGVSLSVPAGSFVAILGSSGSGKTTLLRIIAGFERLDGGSVQLGKDVVDDGRHVFVPIERRHIGYVPQEGALFPHLSVGRNVAFGLGRGPSRPARVMELLDMVGLAGLGRRYPHQLSGGQQQRVALARALATEPEIVLLDEPFSSLDAALRASVRTDVLSVLRQAGTTSVLVTHDQDEALSMADQVAILRSGTIAQRAAPVEIYGHPEDEELAGFLGESNVLEGEVRDGAATTVLGRHSVVAWGGRASGGPARVLVRPEQIDLVPLKAGAIEATVSSYEYFGHDAIVRVRPAAPDLPDLTVRVSGGEPVEPGDRVGLSVHGTVVAWPKLENGVPSRGITLP